MVDVVICCSDEDQPAARQLADALMRAGYAAWFNQGPADFWNSDEVIERIGAARAAIALWSGASLASALFHAEANAARAQGKLIQVSLDGSDPPLPFPQAEIVSLEGWHGETSHRGWRRISDELGSMCGRAPAAAPLSSPDAPLKWLALLVPASLGLAAFAWTSDRQAPAPEPSPVAAPAPAPPAMAAEPKRPMLPPVKAADAGPGRKAAPKAAEKASPRQEARPKRKAEERTESAPPREARLRKAHERPKERPQRQAARSSVRYKYSDNMRLFCQKAGRTTRECRTFRSNAKQGTNRGRIAQAETRAYGPPM